MCLVCSHQNYRIDSIVSGDSANFGNIFGTVYGRGGSVSGIGTSSGFTVAGSGQGAASLYGNRGTSVECEFLNNNPGIPQRHRRFKRGWKYGQAFARPVPAHRGG